MPCDSICTQIAINGNICIPDNKPDLERILRVTSTPVITKVTVLKNKVVFAGHVLIFVEYVACVPGDKQPVHFASFKIPFANFIEHPHAQECLSAKLDVEVEFQEFHALNHRMISKLIILKVCVVKLMERDYEPTPHACPSQTITPCPPKTKPPCEPNPDQCRETHEQIKYCIYCGKQLS